MSLLLLLLTLLLLPVFVISVVDCPRCGSIAVPFPLSTNPSCGQPQYQVNCNGSRLELPALSGSYTVERINPRGRTMVISTPPFAHSSCVTLSNGGLLLNQSQGFNITNGNTFMLLNCTSLILRSPLNCSASSVCHRYIHSVPAASHCKSPESSGICCSFRAGGSSTSYAIRANATGTSCSAYMSVVGMDESLDPGEWNYGVELEWSIPVEPPCGGADQECSSHSSCKLEAQSKSHRCLCDPGFSWDAFTGSCSPACNGGSCSNHRRLVAGLVCAGVVLFAALVLVFFFFSKRRSRRLAERASRARELAMIMSSSGGKTAKVFTAKEMRRATNGFSKERLLGSGGFGEVYKGIMDDGVVVAIKAAKVGNIKGRDQVINEVCVLSQVNHRNLVRIWGCCVDSGEPLLVYEYVPNGTLYDWLHGRKELLDWETRLRIALQTAEGLAYLHSAAYPPIYHRDVKSSNILLDDLMEARVCDFGLSRLAQPDITHVSTCAQGTLGYLDPEYYRKYQLTDKSDVYSFGMVLLEIVTSQKAIDFNRDQDEVNLGIYVMARMEQGGIMDIVDHHLFSFLKDGSPVLTVTKETIVAVVVLALHCLRESRVERPTMKEVVDELSYILDTYKLQTTL